PSSLLSSISSGRRRPGYAESSMQRACQSPSHAVEQFQLHLAGPPAEARQLDARRLSGEVAVRLRHTADRPAQVAQKLPEAQRRVIHLGPAGRLVRLVDLLGLADAAQLEVVAAEAPRADARPGEVLGGVADVGELPVEDAHQPLRPDHEVADAEVAVDQ